MRDTTPPPGYTRLAVGDATVVALSPLAEPVREAMREGSLFEYAAHHPGARALAGRGVAYAVPLPDGETRVVVRHSRHGGLLAPVTGDLFLFPTRAPRELEMALRLARCGVSTPEVVAYALHPAGGPLRRADVATREVPDGRDLGDLLAESPPLARKREALRAAASLLARMADVGARHPDLNVKNVFVAPDENGRPEAWLLDVDRVWFDEPGVRRVADANLRRLARSARKWRRERGIALDEGDLLWLAAAIDDELGGAEAATA
jgi:hypothetical protein